MKIVFTLLLFCSLPLFASGKCGKLFGDFDDFPPGWGFRPGEAISLIERHPDAKESLIALAETVHFFEDPVHQALFDELRLLSAIGTSTDHFNWDEHLAQMQAETTSEAIKNSISKARALSGFVTALEMPLLQPPISLATLDADAVRAWALRYPDRLPSLAALLNHSYVAQLQMTRYMLANEKSQLSEDQQFELLTVFRRRLRGEKIEPSQPVLEPLSIIEALAEARPWVSYRDPIARKKLLRDARKTKPSRQLEATFDQTKRVLFSRVISTYAQAIQNVFSDNDQSDPWTAHLMWKKIIEADAFSDQTLAPFFRTFLVEFYLGRRLISPTHFLSEMKRRWVTAEIKPLAIWFRQQNQPGSQPTLAPKLKSRDERLEEYVQSKPAEPEPILSGAEPEARAPIEPIEEIQGAELRALAEDKGPLDLAREKFSQLVRPDEEVTLQVRHPNKVVRRMVFSPNVVQSLLNPEPGEPSDLRRWLRALCYGNAADENQSGWKKLQRSDWEIKLHPTRFRIFGVEKNDVYYWHELVDAK